MLYLDVYQMQRHQSGGDPTKGDGDPFQIP